MTSGESLRAGRLPTGVLILAIPLVTYLVLVFIDSRLNRGTAHLFGNSMGCRTTLLFFAGSLEDWQQERGLSLATYTLSLLLSSGALPRIPECPSHGHYLRDRNGTFRCTYHGDSAYIEKAHRAASPSLATLLRKVGFRWLAFHLQSWMLQGAFPPP